MPSIIAVIPAKEMSNRIANKNRREIAGKRMFRWILDAAAESGVFECIYLSSDKYYSEDDIMDKAVYSERPIDLTGDVPATEVTKHVIETHYRDSWRRPEWTCLLQPSSPCVRMESIRAAAKLCSEDVDGVIACAAGKNEPCGAFYFLRTHVAMQLTSIVEAANIMLDADRLIWYPLPSDESVDVDCHWDMRLAEYILEDRKNV